MSSTDDFGAVRAETRSFWLEEVLQAAINVGRRVGGGGELSWKKQKQNSGFRGLCHNVFS